jgi:hypothetical protein
MRSWIKPAYCMFPRYSASCWYPVQLNTDGAHVWGAEQLLQVRCRRHHYLLCVGDGYCAAICRATNSVLLPTSSYHTSLFSALTMHRPA